MLISFLFKINVFWVFFCRSYCFVLESFVQEFPKGGDCKETNVDKSSIRIWSHRPETPLAIGRVNLAIARMAWVAQSDLDSM